MRNFLTFESALTDDGKWTDSDELLQPGGLEHSKLFVSCLPSSITLASDPWNEEDYGWEFLTMTNGISVGVLVQAGENDDGWLLQIIPVALLRFLRRKKVDSAVDTVADAIEAFLRRDSRFRNVQRCSQAEYEHYIRSRFAGH